jgi:flagellar basal body rod protein FlgG
MINAFYSALSGMTSFQNKLNISANNTANVNTTAFKAQTAAYIDLDYTDVYTLQEEQKEIKVGSGVRLSSANSTLQQGSIEQTGRAIDIAIEGEGYFKIKDQNGNQYYTRAGSFQIQKKGSESFLVTSNGESVLDNNNQPIKILGQIENVKFSTDNSSASSTSYNSSDDTKQDYVAKIGVYTFDNPYALVKDGYGRLKESDASGEGKVFYGAHIRQGALERSNVDMATEMTNILLAQRGFSFNSKIIQTADELENIANNLR